MTYFQDFENVVGKEVTSLILKEVSEGKFIVNQAREFAYHLHPFVGGSFVHTRGLPNFKFDRGAMQTILSDWYSEDVCKDNLSKEDVIAKLVSALKNSDKHVIAKNIKKMFPDMFWPKAGENTNAVVVGPHNGDISNMVGYDIDNRKKRPIINCGDEMSDISPIFQERENGGHIKVNLPKERIGAQVSFEQLPVVDHQGVV